MHGDNMKSLDSVLSQEILNENAQSNILTIDFNSSSGHSTLSSSPPPSVTSSNGTFETEISSLNSTSHPAVQDCDCYSPPQSMDISTFTKNELRFMIQSRRHSEGKPSLTASEFNSFTPNENKISPEGGFKMNDRREKNKLSAQKCRDKKKFDLDCIKKKLEDTENENKKLKRALSIANNRQTLLLDTNTELLTVCPQMNSFLVQLEGFNHNNA